MGLVIGKGGQTIHAIRKILTVRAIAENVRVNLQLNEPETPVITSEVEPEVKSDADTSDVNEEDPNKIASSDKPS